MPVIINEFEIVADAPGAGAAAAPGPQQPAEPAPAAATKPADISETLGHLRARARRLRPT